MPLYKDRNTPNCRRIALLVTFCETLLLCGDTFRHAVDVLHLCAPNDQGTGSNVPCPGAR